ncbi:MAG: carboxypeptidase regulatory-like domain-containing protein [Pyrinomonadaceae bacterium]
MFLVKELKVKTYLFGISFVIGMLLLSQSVLASTISGTVYDNHRNPLSDVDVELLNDYYQQINRTRTDGSGRYQFSGLSDGRYSVNVLPFRYDLIEQSHPIEINTINARGGQGNTFITEDFYLMPKKGSLADSEIGVIFAQEVPAEAKKVYEQAVKDISRSRKDEGLSGLREAIKIFPKYYLALYQLGKELSIKGEYGEAVPILIRAAEVNPQSPTTLYYLGYSLLKLNYSKPAIIALTQAHILAPASIQVLFVLGKAERLESKYEDAEKHLLQAKKLSKVGVPEIYKELAQLYANNLRKYKEAADELELYMKASKLSNEEEQKTKKIINDLREKAKTQLSKS